MGISDFRQLYHLAMAHLSILVCHSSSGERTHDSRVLYALLCEYAHPTMGGAKGFVKVHEEGRKGWMLSYDFSEKFKKKDVKTAVSILLRNMRLGYANAMLLVNGELEDTPKGVIYYPPSPEIGALIWQGILQQKIPEDSN
jgi:hypothetical protein